MRTPSVSECTWLAAAIDGEGSLSFSKCKRKNPKPGNRQFNWCVQFKVANNNRAFCQRVLDIIGAGSIIKREWKNPNYRPTFYYEASSGVLRHILPKVLPHLIVKKQIAQLMMAALNLLWHHTHTRKGGSAGSNYVHGRRLDIIWRKLRKLNAHVVVLCLLFTPFVYAECRGDYLFHDHYKIGYRIRHWHCVESLSEHYKDDPLRQQYFHLPEESDPQEPKEPEPNVTIQLQIAPPQGTERNEDSTRYLI